MAIQGSIVVPLVGTIAIVPGTNALRRACEAIAIATVSQGTIIPRVSQGTIIPKASILVASNLISAVISAVISGVGCRNDGHDDVRMFIEQSLPCHLHPLLAIVGPAMDHSPGAHL